MRFLIILSLMSCSPIVGTQYEYWVDCVTVKSTWPIQSSKLTNHIQIVSDMYRARFPDSTWCQDVYRSGTSTIVVVAEQWNCTPTSCNTGWFEFGKITLYGPRSPLLHESFHMKDSLQGFLFFGDHPNWEEKGYYKLSQEFESIPGNNLFDPPDQNYQP